LRWQRPRIKSDIEQAQSVVAQRSAEYAGLQGRVDYEVRREFIDLAAAADQVALAQKNVGLARDTLTQSQDRFKAGVTDTVEVVQAQQTVEQAVCARRRKGRSTSESCSTESPC
jgi:outer membrane protein TolC